MIVCAVLTYPGYVLLGVGTAATEAVRLQQFHCRPWTRGDYATTAGGSKPQHTL